LKCMPGTGNVVTYMVTHLYRYKVPTIKKNRRPIIALQTERNQIQSQRKYQLEKDHRIGHMV